MSGKDWYNISGNEFTMNNNAPPDHFTFSDDIKTMTTKIIIGDKVAVIKDELFENFIQLKEIDFSNSSRLHTINDLAFSDCHSIQKLEFPSNLNYIKDSSFINCSNILLLDFSKITGNLKIEEKAFVNSSKINTIIFPSKKILQEFEIEDEVFSFSNKNEVNFTISNTEPITKKGFTDFIKYCKNNQLEINKSILDTAFQCITYKKENILIMNRECPPPPPKEDGSSYNNPEDINYWGNSKFKTQIEHIIITKGVRVINKGLFYGFNNLQKIDFSGATKLKTIGESAFQGCTGLTNLDFSGAIKLKTIEKSAFQDCTGLTELNFKGAKKLQFIRESAFQDCTGLKNLDFSENNKLQDIEVNAFNKVKKENVTSPTEVRVNMEDCCSNPSAVTSFGGGYRKNRNNNKKNNKKRKTRKTNKKRKQRKRQTKRKRQTRKRN